MIPRWNLMLASTTGRATGHARASCRRDDDEHPLIENTSSNTLVNELEEALSARAPAVESMSEVIGRRRPGLLAVMQNGMDRR